VALLDTHKIIRPALEAAPLTAGLCLVITVIAVGVATFVTNFPVIYAGIPAWLAGALLWRGVPARSKIQALVLFCIGAIGAYVGVMAGGGVAWNEAISSNSGLIALLAAVSFLRLITVPRSDQPLRRAHGPRSAVATLLGVHFFGAVINLPTVFLMARHMATNGRLRREQYSLLVKGFAAAAFYSPFFAAMAAALTYAPGAKFSLLLGFGLPLAGLALLLLSIGIWRGRHGVSKDPPIDVAKPPQNMPVQRFVLERFVPVQNFGQDFEGYPMNLSSLWVPGVLAAGVLLLHTWQPTLSVLGLISVLAPAVTVITLAARQRPVRADIAQHLQEGLPAMRSELALFLSAGVMAAGVGSATLALDIALPFATFGGLEAAILLGGLVGVAVMGVHPVIGISLAAALVAPLDPDPSLLASTFLAAWGIGVAVSPFSALNLSMQGGFGIRASDILRWNMPFGLALLAGASGLLLLHPAG